MKIRIRTSLYIILAVLSLKRHASYSGRLDSFFGRSILLLYTDSDKYKGRIKNGEPTLYERTCR